MLSKDLMFDVDSNVSDEVEDNFKGGTMNGLDKHAIGRMHVNTTNDIFGDANNNSHVLGQKGQELNDPYAFVDEEEFNAKLGPRGEIVFA
jgi:hypothetical protein